jgi:Arc/MetJ family transcription regulator
LGGGAGYDRQVELGQARHTRRPGEGPGAEITVVFTGLPADVAMAPGATARGRRRQRILRERYRRQHSRVYAAVVKTMIDLDDEALALAARELGTTTKKDTVNAALAFVAERRRRIAALLEDPLALGVGPDIADAEIM